MTLHHKVGRFWQCDWCRIVRVNPDCACVERFASFGNRWKFEVEGEKATCLVCRRQWKTKGKPRIQHACGPVPNGGPGTTLKGILSRWGFATCGSCESFAKLMDKWGKDGCLDRFDDICDRLTSEALRRWLPPVGVRDLVYSAIENTT